MYFYVIHVAQFEVLLPPSQAQRLHEKKEHSTQEHVFDPKTRLLLFKLVDAGVLSEVNGCVSTGKEANIYHAGGGRWAEPECALYAWILTNCIYMYLHHTARNHVWQSQVENKHYSVMCFDRIHAIKALYL